MASYPSDVPMNGARQGPHPSFIQVAKPYIFEHQLHACRAAIGVSEAKEDTIRLQGVTWIDNVRKALQLYVLKLRVCYGLLIQKACPIL